MKCNRFLRFVAIAGIIASLVLSITATPVLAKPGIVLSPDSGSVGTTVSVTGSGFDDTTYSTVYLFFDTTYVAYASVDSDGNFPDTTSFTVPSANPGEHYVTVQGSSTYGLNPLTIATFDVTKRQITLDSTSGYVGAEIGVSGAGFYPDSTVTIYFDNVAVHAVTADTYGSFNGAIFTIPECYNGTHIIMGSDGTGDSQPVSFTTLQQTIVTPTSGAIGDQVTIRGTGFASTSRITFYLDDKLLNINTTTDANGSFTSNAFKTPSKPGGNYTIKARDASDNYATASYTIEQKVSITLASGIIGTKVGISGSGFFANSPITIIIPNKTISTIPASIITNNEGIFTASFNVPDHPSGSHEVLVYDGTNVGSQVFTVLAMASMSQTEGCVGDEVTLSGNGFQKLRLLTVTFNIENVAIGATDANGNFSTSFNVPPIAAGTYQVTISDGINTKEFSFKTITSASLSPETSTTSPGHVGTDVTISGIGFTAGEMVHITFDETEVAETAVNSDRTFSTMFSIPASTGGNHTIVATDGTNNLSFPFVMESNSPPAPALITPETNTKAKTETYFDWEDVTDPSGVSYDLQIASDNTFSDSSIVHEMEGLTISEYTLTDGVKLDPVSKDTPYYWRARATDGASNQGTWSEPVSFYVGFQWFKMEGTLVWASIGITVALGLVFGFRQVKTLLIQMIHLL